MKVFRWIFEGYDLVGRPGGLTNYVAIRADQPGLVEAEDYQAGGFRFAVGRRYDRLGMPTPEGWVGLQLAPQTQLEYVGHTGGRFLLFRRIQAGHRLLPGRRDLFGQLCGRYHDVYFAFLVHPSQPGRLFWLTKARKASSIQLPDYHLNGIPE